MHGTDEPVLVDQELPGCPIESTSGVRADIQERHDVIASAQQDQGFLNAIHQGLDLAGATVGNIRKCDQARAARAAIGITDACAHLPAPDCAPILDAPIVPRRIHRMFRYRRVWSWLQPQRPRHPMARLLLGLFVVCALALMLLIGAVAGTVVLVASLVWRALRPHPPLARVRGDSPAADSDVIDGQYSVLRKPLDRIAHP